MQYRIQLNHLQVGAMLTVCELHHNVHMSLFHKLKNLDELLILTITEAERLYMLEAAESSRVFSVLVRYLDDSDQSLNLMAGMLLELPNVELENPGILHGFAL